MINEDGCGCAEDNLNGDVGGNCDNDNDKIMVAVAVIMMMMVMTVSCWNNHKIALSWTN